MKSLVGTPYYIAP